MKYIFFLAPCLLLLVYSGTAQNVQRWENWQSNFFLTNSAALSQPDQRNVGLQLWLDRGFGMELHYRNTWGTALFTRSSNEAIWLGNYGTAQDQQQHFNPWMTLVNGNVGIGTTTPGTRLEVAGSMLLHTGDPDGPRLVWHGGAGGGQEYRSRLAPDGHLAFFPAEGIPTTLALTQNGNVGIGTTTPAHPLTIVKNGFEMTSFGIAKYPQLMVNGNNQNGGGIAISDDGGFFDWNDGYVTYEPLCCGSGLRISRSNFIVDNNVGIGTTDTKGYKLAVNGDAIFTKVKVKGFANWPDYVFDLNYRLRPLNELEQYIQKHQHLPDVPSAKEVQTEGIDLGSNQSILLQKIEELTLYIIQQDKRISELESGKVPGSRKSRKSVKTAR